MIGRSALGPTTSTPFPRFSSDLTPAIVVALSERSTRPSVSDSRMVTSSSFTALVRSSLSPMLLRASVVRTSDPVLFSPIPSPARKPVSLDGVPRSCTVESTESKRPPPDTTRNGRPSPIGSGPPVFLSNEPTVTPRRLSLPLPV